MTKQSQWKKQRLESLRWGSIILLLIALSPLLAYIHKVVPETEVWETPFFTYNSGYFLNVQTFVWTMMSKILPIFLLSVWFATCKHWWYHAIAIPIGMFIIQTVGLVLLDFNAYQDEIDFVITVPLIVGIMLILYFIRSNLSKNIEVINLDDDIDKEIEKLERLDELKARLPHEEDNY